MSDTHTPPKSVQANGQRALELIRAGKAGPGFTDTGRKRAQQLANGDALSTETVRRMAAYFRRHEKSDQGRQDEDGTAANVAWLAWGGDSGKRWADSIVDRLDGEDDDSETTTASGQVIVAAAPSFGGPWAFPDQAEADALTAAISGRIPTSPPAEWFDPDQVPELDGPLTFTEDGRVFGLLAPRDVPHIGLPGQNRHAPYSASGYSWYHTGQVRCADGSLVSTGRVTMGGGHCDLTADAAGAARWYDDVGTAIADVVAWDTPGGVMCAGAARPHLSAEQIRTAMASPPSGDWRPIKGDLEMVGAHLVNVAGFPASRAALAASGTPTALIASGAAPFRIVAAALTAANSDPVGTVYEDGSVKGGKKSGGGGSSGWDESKHPRDAIGQWAPKDEAGKQAQRDAGARSNYGKLEGASDADADKMLKGMSDTDLRKLTAFAYSSKTSDPRIVKARIKVANEMGRRGIDIKKHGARGGGSKSATRASAEPVAAPETEVQVESVNEDDVDVAGLLAAGDGPPAPHDKPAADADDSDDKAGQVSFAEGDRVTIGDTGLSGHVQSVDDGQAHVSVTVKVEALTAAEDDEDEAVAAAADPNTSMLEGLTASVSALTDMVASMQAERRAEKAQSILDGLR